MSTIRVCSLVLFGLASINGIHGGAQKPPSPRENLVAMGIVGYADRLSVQPGETIQFMVSSQLPRYQAEIVRLIHGDPNPRGPGMKEEVIEAPVNREYAGRHQDLVVGSYAEVTDAQPLRLTGSFTITAWIAATRPGQVGWANERASQGIVTKWSEVDGRGYGLFLDADGRLAVRVGAGPGQVATLAVEPALRPWAPAIFGANQRRRSQGVPTKWYFVAASFDAGSRTLTVYQQPIDGQPNDPTQVMVEQPIQISGPASTDVSLLMAAHWAEDGQVGGYSSGKIDNPRLYDRALSRAEIEAIGQGAGPTDAVASWDFSADVSSDRVRDTTSSQLDG